MAHEDVVVGQPHLGVLAVVCAGNGGDNDLRQGPGNSLSKLVLAKHCTADPDIGALRSVPRDVAAEIEGDLDPQVTPLGTRIILVDRDHDEFVPLLRIIRDFARGPTILHVLRSRGCDAQGICDSRRLQDGGQVGEVDVVPPCANVLCPNDLSSAPFVPALHGVPTGEFQHETLFCSRPLLDRCFATRVICNPLREIVSIHLVQVDMLVVRRRDSHDRLSSDSSTVDVDVDDSSPQFRSDGIFDELQVRGRETAGGSASRGAAIQLLPAREAAAGGGGGSQAGDAVDVPLCLL
mmetsp:Transcript_77837/g.170481  ORF Transcript_77837/g.170481 Transcript_77837/m.170481 type:complete len:293 (-) Transcript_77837:578-1456(-)